MELEDMVLRKISQLRDRIALTQKMQKKKNSYPAPFPPESLNCPGVRNEGNHPFLLPHFLLFMVYLSTK